MMLDNEGNALFGFHRYACFLSIKEYITNLQYYLTILLHHKLQYH